MLYLSFRLNCLATKCFKKLNFIVQKVIFFYVIISQHICSTENKLFFPHEKINCFSISENNFSVKLFAALVTFSLKKQTRRAHEGERMGKKEICS
jgi:hypothetical protein